MGGCVLSQEGNDFYITGADSVRKKLGEVQRTALSSGRLGYQDGTIHKLTGDASGINGYQNFTVDNFVAEITGNIVGRDKTGNNTTFKVSKGYNPSTGIITISGTQSGGTQVAFVDATIYCYHN